MGFKNALFKHPNMEMQTMSDHTWAILTPDTYDALWRATEPLTRFVDKSLLEAGTPHLIVSKIGCFLSSAYPVPAECLRSVTIDPALSQAMIRGALRLIQQQETT